MAPVEDEEMTVVMDPKLSGASCFPTPSTSPTTVPVEEQEEKLLPKEPPVSLSTADLVQPKFRLVLPPSLLSSAVPETASSTETAPAPIIPTPVQVTSSKAKKTGKKCEACSATSTPQWRRGPSGARTLCNACGVKYSQGRPLLIHSGPRFQQQQELQQQESQVRQEEDVSRPITAAKVYYKSTDTPNVIQKVLETRSGNRVGTAQVLLHASPVSPTQPSAASRAVISHAQESQKRKRGYRLSDAAVDQWMAEDILLEESSESVGDEELFSSSDEATILTDFVETVHWRNDERAAHRAKLHL